MSLAITVGDQTLMSLGLQRAVSHVPGWRGLKAPQSQLLRSVLKWTPKQVAVQAPWFSFVKEEWSLPGLRAATSYGDWQGDLVLRGSWQKSCQALAGVLLPSWGCREMLAWRSALSWDLGLSFICRRLRQGTGHKWKRCGRSRFFGNSTREMGVRAERAKETQRNCPRSRGSSECVCESVCVSIRVSV